MHTAVRVGMWGVGVDRGDVEYACIHISQLERRRNITCSEIFFVARNFFCFVVQGAGSHKNKGK